MWLTPKLTNGSNGSFNSRQKIDMASKLDGPWPGKKDARKKDAESIIEWPRTTIESQHVLRRKNQAMT